MIGAALTYPFLLLRRRPIFMIGFIVLCAIATMLAEYVMVQAVVSLRPTGGPDNVSYRIFSYARSITAAFLGCGVAALTLAFVMARTLLDLEIRPPEMKLHVVDAVIALAVTWVFLLVTYLPFLLVLAGADIVLEEIMRHVPQRVRDTRPLIQFGLYLLLAFGYFLVFARVALAWPHALTQRRFVFFGAMPLTRGRFWLMVGRLTTLFIVVCAVMIAAGAGSMVLTQLIYNGEAVSEWAWVWTSFFQALAISFALYHFAVAISYVYANVIPPRPEVVARQF